MRSWSRSLLAVAALLLAATFFAPIWRISLRAPQYPEGLRLYIWSDRMTGDLRSINNLNHYIGMKAIHPEMIPELELMRPVILGLIGLGLAVALWRRRAGLLIWTGLLGTGALVGFIDFWKWGYDYGHHLDPAAAIRIPGMSYQPPLLGPKQLLNFRATSWPSLAGWAAVASLVVALTLCALELRRGRPAD